MNCSSRNVDATSLTHAYNLLWIEEASRCGSYATGSRYGALAKKRQTGHTQITIKENLQDFRLCAQNEIFQFKVQEFVRRAPLSRDGIKCTVCSPNAVFLQDRAALRTNAADGEPSRIRKGFDYFLHVFLGIRASWFRGRGGQPLAHLRMWEETWSIKKQFCESTFNCQHWTMYIYYYGLFIYLLTHS